jgi:hypothetical protein
MLNITYQLQIQYKLTLTRNSSVREPKSYFVSSMRVNYEAGGKKALPQFYLHTILDLF